MDRRTFLRAASTGLFATAAGPGLSAAGAARSPHIDKRPNILFINTDDQAQWGVGAYGNRDIYTPNMDRLAAEGIKFTRAFTCPVCSPSRAMTMTGCYNHQLSIEDWIAPAEPVGLPGNVPTIAEALQRGGYRTALVGKWHLGHTKAEFHPTRRGFDYFAGFLQGSEKVMDPTLEVNGRTKKFQGGLTDVLADLSISFLRTHREKPFAMFFHPFRPHSPYVPVPEEDWEPYKGKKLPVPRVEGVDEDRIRKITEKYYASISSVDRNLGRILAELEKLGILDNTFIVFTGDNGYNIGQHGLWHKGNGSLLANGQTYPNIFDTSSLVPLIIRYPELAKPGTVCEEMVSSIDHFPTLLSVAGLERSPGTLLEGLDMTPLIKNERTTWRDELFLAYNQHHYRPNAMMRMIRTADWKLIHHYEQGRDHELFDLQKDPLESISLFGEPEYRNVQNELDRRLILWEKRTGACG
jgi:arylsulfatase A-like enzyme